MTKQELTKHQEELKTMMTTIKNDPELLYEFQHQFADIIFKTIRNAQKEKRKSSKYGTEHLTVSELQKSCYVGVLLYLKQISGETETEASYE